MTAKMQAKPRYTAQYQEQTRVYVPTPLERFVESVADKLHYELSSAQIDDSQHFKLSREDSTQKITYSRFLAPGVNESLDDVLDNSAHGLVEYAKIGLVTFKYYLGETGGLIKGLVEYACDKKKRRKTEKLLETKHYDVWADGISFNVAYAPANGRSFELESILSGVVGQSGIRKRKRKDKT
jgi:hypothetical protein